MMLLQIWLYFKRVRFIIKLLLEIDALFSWSVSIPVFHGMGAYYSWSMSSSHLPSHLHVVYVCADALQGQEQGIGSAGAVLGNHPMWALATDPGPSFCKSSTLKLSILLSSPTSCFVWNSITHWIWGSLILLDWPARQAPVIHVSPPPQCQDYRCIRLFLGFV